jgi:hypothetical protein
MVRKKTPLGAEQKVTLLADQTSYTNPKKIEQNHMRLRSNQTHFTI